MILPLDPFIFKVIVLNVYLIFIIYNLILKRSFYNFYSDEEFDFNGKSCHDPSMGETEKVWKVIKFVASFIIPFAVISKLSLRAKTYLVFKN